jgi:hypothetical protein
VTRPFIDVIVTSLICHKNPVVVRRNLHNIRENKRNIVLLLLLIEIIIIIIRVGHERGIETTSIRYKRKELITFYFEYFVLTIIFLNNNFSETFVDVVIKL